MRRAPVVLVLALALTGGACSDRGNVGGNDDGGADAPVVQLDANPQQDSSAQQDTGPQRDAPPANYDSGTGVVPCGTASCNVNAGEECCITYPTLSCLPAGTCAGQGTITCDGPEDCYNTATPICCGHISGSGGGASCVAESACTGNAMRLCRADGDCGSGDKCCGSLAVGAISFQYCMAEASCATSNPTPGVPCGTGATCYAPDACCMTFGGGSCGSVASCTQGVPLECDGPEDCQQDGGTPQVCCGNITYSGTISGGSSCVTTCTPTGLIGGVLCHTDADCVSPKTCKTTGYGGYSLRLCR